MPITPDAITKALRHSSVSNQTFACLHCRKLWRRPKYIVKEFTCTHCGATCIAVHWKLHVPAPGKVREWNKFWEQYLLELRLIEQHTAGIGPDEVDLPLLNQKLTRPKPEKPKTRVETCRR
jgi:hypothetical protein